MAVCRGWKVAFALIALNLAIIPFGGTQPAKAQDQDIAQGTPCEGTPTDEDTKSACVVAVLDCTFMRVYGRTEEEKDRLFKGCVRKIVARYRKASNATGDAARREFLDRPENRAADKAAARKKAQEQAAVAATQARQVRVQQQAWQWRVDTVKRACTTGQGTLDVTGVTQVAGTMGAWAYTGQVVQPLADPEAVATGKCSVEFVQNNRNVAGRIDMSSLEPTGRPPAFDASVGN